MSEIQADTIFQRVELLGSRIQDEMVFFDQNAGKYFATGPVGADIWEFLDSPRTFPAICDHLLGVYEIDRAACEVEVRAFLGQMLDAGIIEAKRA